MKDAKLSRKIGGLSPKTPQVCADTCGVFCGRSAARMLTWALPGNAKGIYDLVERGNTSFDFTFRHRVPAVGHFEMNNRPQNTKPPLSEGERRFYFCREDDACTAAGHCPNGRGVQRSRGGST